MTLAHVTVTYGTRQFSLSEAKKPGQAQMNLNHVIFSVATIYGHDSPIEEGDYLVLTCGIRLEFLNATLVRTLSFRWTFTHTHTSRGRHPIGYEKTFKKRVDKHDTGYYTCEARASIGSWTDTVRVQVMDEDYSLLITFFFIVFGFPIVMALLAFEVFICLNLKKNQRLTQG